MSIIVNGTTVGTVFCNGIELTEVWADGVQVWGATAVSEPFWVCPHQNTTVRLKINVGSTLCSKGFRYSFDTSNWISITASDFLNNGISVNAGQKLFVASDDELAFNSCGIIPDEGLYSIGGEIKSLFNQSDTIPVDGLSSAFRGSNLSSATSLVFPSKCDSDGCSSMFLGCSNLVIPPPALCSSSIGSKGCSYMFQGCSSLIKAPSLPATSVGASGYYSMFAQCSSMVASPPTLPATLIQKEAYRYMFNSCSSMTSAPSIQATNLSYDSSMQSGCQQMFQYCSNLVYLPAIRFKSMREACCANMFQGCSSIKMSTTQTAECPNAYRIPIEGTGTTASVAFANMFMSTGGTFKGTPSINTTYYTNATVI